MGVLKDYITKDGCHIRIMDDFIVTDPIEKQKILDNIARIYIDEMRSKFIEDEKRKSLNAKGEVEYERNKC